MVNPIPTLLFDVAIVATTAWIIISMIRDSRRRE